MTLWINFVWKCISGSNVCMNSKRNQKMNRTRVECFWKRECRSFFKGKIREIWKTCSVEYIECFLFFNFQSNNHMIDFIKHQPTTYRINLIAICLTFPKHSTPNSHLFASSTNLAFKTTFAAEFSRRFSARTTTVRGVGDVWKPPFLEWDLNRLTPPVNLVSSGLDPGADYWVWTETLIDTNGRIGDRENRVSGSIDRRIFESTDF